MLPSDSLKTTVDCWTLLAGASMRGATRGSTQALKRMSPRPMCWLLELPVIPAR